MRLHLATGADVPAIHALLVENAANDGGRIAGTTDSLLRHGFGPQSLFRAVLARDGDTPLGLSLFFPEYSSWRGVAGLFIQDLYVRPDARGRGLGRALLAQSLRVSADWEPAFVTLMAHRANATAHTFYARAGFVQRAPADVLICEGAPLTRLVTG